MHLKEHITALNYFIIAAGIVTTVVSLTTDFIRPINFYVFILSTVFFIALGIALFNSRIKPSFKKNIRYSMVTFFLLIVLSVGSLISQTNYVSKLIFTYFYSHEQQLAKLSYSMDRDGFKKALLNQNSQAISIFMKSAFKKNVARSIIFDRFQNTNTSIFVTLAKNRFFKTNLGTSLLAYIDEFKCDDSIRIFKSGANNNTKIINYIEFLILSNSFNYISSNITKCSPNFIDSNHYIMTIPSMDIYYTAYSQNFLTRDEKFDLFRLFHKNKITIEPWALRIPGLNKFFNSIYPLENGRREKCISLNRQCKFVNSILGKYKAKKYMNKKDALPDSIANAEFSISSYYGLFGNYHVFMGFSRVENEYSVHLLYARDGNIIPKFKEALEKVKKMRPLRAWFLNLVLGELMAPHKRYIYSFKNDGSRLKILYSNNGRKLFYPSPAPKRQSIVMYTDFPTINGIDLSDQNYAIEYEKADQ